MTGFFQAFDLDELQKKQAEATSAYNEFLRRRGMSVGMYFLPAGGEDHQHPHAADEMYVVLRGRGTLRIGDQEQEVHAGSVVSVDHGEDHRFINIAEDLNVLVVFAPPDSPDDSD